MDIRNETKVGKPAADTVRVIAQELCDLLLQVAGRDTNRLPSVRRHAGVLAAAMPYMTTGQADVARQRIRRFETKWGLVLPGIQEETDIATVSAELRVAEWLSMRRSPEALLQIVRRAASAIWTGVDSLLDVQEYAYAEVIGRTPAPTGYDSFKEWMIQLRIAEFRHGGAFHPGNLCHWWVDQMAPSKSPDSAYSLCLTELELLKTKRRS